MLPRIQDIIKRRTGYKYFTKIDLALCYYTYQLDEETSWQCIIVTPFGKYRRLTLPMGATQSPDIAQAAIEEVFHDMLRDEIEAYLDGVGCFTMEDSTSTQTDFQRHMQLLDTVLQRLKDHNYTVNVAKCLGRAGDRLARPLDDTKWCLTLGQESPRHHSSRPTANQKTTQGLPQHD